MRKGESIFQPFLTFNRYLLPYWPLEALVLLAAFLNSFLGLLGPYLTRITIDQVFGMRNFYLFHILIFTGFILFLFQGFLTVLNQYLSAYIGLLLTFDLRRDYARHLFRLSYPDFHRRPTGEQIYRLGQDIDTVSTLATDSIPQVLSTALRLFFLLMICLYLNWRLTLITLIISPLFYLQARYFGNKQKLITRQIKQKGQDTLSELQDNLSNIKLIKVFGKTRWATSNYLRQWLKLIRLDLDLLRSNISGNLVAGLLNTATLTGFSYYIGYNVIKGNVTLGTLVALMLYLVQLFDGIKSLGGLYRGVMVKFVSWERVQETLSLAPEAEPREAVALAEVKGAIDYENVSFGYLPGKAVLENLSFKILPGEYVGIVGPSGCGKTTLLLLLLRLLRPWEGRIKIDGFDLNAIRWKSLQPFIGLALQEAFVLNRSLRDNLRFGRPAATESEMWRALGIADLDATVKEMEKGLEAPVGEGGSNLSEGQRQRLNIARALIGRPRILILDEATSAVGFDSEKKILSSIRKELKDSTLIIVSHRLLSLQDADRLLVLREGKLVEEGAHPELMKKEGFYHHLFSEQFHPLTPPSPLFKGRGEG